MEDLKCKQDLAEENIFKWQQHLSSSKATQVLQEAQATLSRQFVPKPLSNSRPDYEWHRKGTSTVNKSLLESHTHEAQHSNKFQQINHEAQPPAGLDLDNLPTDELVQRLQRTTEIVTEGMEACAKYSKTLRIACEYGWPTAHEFDDPSFLNEEGDPARLRRAITSASAKENAAKRTQGGPRLAPFRANNAPRPFAKQNVSQPNGQSGQPNGPTPVRCFICNGGHYASQCPNKGRVGRQGR